MKTAFKASVLICLVTLAVIQGTLAPSTLPAILLVVGIHTVRVRLYDSPYLLAIEFAAVTLAVYFGTPLALWYVVLAFDLATCRAFWGIGAIAACFYVLGLYKSDPMLPLLVGISSLLALCIERLERENREHKATLDEERRLRYALEEAKQKLLRSQGEVAHIAEVQERNRIARELHDYVGHSIAGVLIQMQVAERCITTDSDRASEAIGKSVVKLAETLEIMRDTVHNMRPSDKLGLDYVKSIVEGFDYCEVDLTHSGDFSTLTPGLVEATAAIIKEALTNASKYSRATRVRIELAINDKFLRVFIRDNGIGCKKIHEGLGLSSMRERVANLGGTISVSGEDGFLIVCVLYK